MNSKPRPQNEILVPFRGVFENFRPPWACNWPISSIAAYYQPVFSVTTEVDKKKKTFTLYLSIVEL